MGRAWSRRDGNWGPDAINSLVNIGYGEDISIRELAAVVHCVVGYEGSVAFDATKRDGMPRKLLDSTRLRATRWQPSLPLQEGVLRTIRWFLEHYAEARP